MSRELAALVYEVSFKGTAGDTLRASFDDCVLRVGDGLTVVRCQTCRLSDVFDRLESLGLELLDVRLVAEPAAGDDWTRHGRVGPN